MGTLRYVCMWVYRICMFLNTRLYHSSDIVQFCVDQVVLYYLSSMVHKQVKHQMPTSPTDKPSHQRSEWNQTSVGHRKNHELCDGLELTTDGFGSEQFHPALNIDEIQFCVCTQLFKSSFHMKNEFSQMSLNEKKIFSYSYV